MFDNLKVDPKVDEVVKNFTLPRELPFGTVMSPIMVTCEFYNGHWGDLELKPYGPISLDPTCKVLHYGQEIFEGVKAYNVGGTGPFLFRPLENFNRFNKSAARMAMCEVPENIYMNAVKAITAYSADIMPKRSGESLYIRPFLFATEKHLGIKPSQRFQFMVIASPSGAYITTDNMPVFIERDHVRAVEGGTGQAKTGGNYAASLYSSLKAKDKGFMQVLWLDSVKRKYIEELSGMNFCCIINDELYTPKISGSILEGVTRKSLLQIASDMGIKTHEIDIDIDELLLKIKSGECSEAFACGTASIVMPIGMLGDNSGEKFYLKNPEGPFARKLKEALLDIQEGRSEDKHGWREKIEPAVF